MNFGGSWCYPRGERTVRVVGSVLARNGQLTCVRGSEVVRACGGCESSHGFILETVDSWAEVEQLSKSAVLPAVIVLTFRNRLGFFFVVMLEKHLESVL